jgi:hypothetical protein
MSLVAYLLVFVLPMLALVALARALDQEPSRRLREATIFNLALVFIGIIVLTIVELLVSTL